MEDLCLHKLAPQLYDKLLAEMDAACGAAVAQLAAAEAASGGASGEEAALSFLSRLDAAWLAHCEATRSVRSVFTVLDRTFCLAPPGSLPPSTAAVRPLWDASLLLLRARLAAQPQLSRRATRGLLALVARERAGDVAPRALLRSQVRMHAQLGTYAESFERPFLEETAAFYLAEGGRLISATDVPAFLRAAEARLGEEVERCAACLEQCTRKPLVQAVEQTLLARHVGVILERGFDELMAADGALAGAPGAACARLPDLQRLYSLLCRVGAQEALKAALSSFIRRTGSKLVKDESKDGELVSAMLALKARCDAVLVQAFDRADALGNAMKDAFETVLNSRANRPAELVAKYIDSALRGGGGGGGGERGEAAAGPAKGLSEEELEALLDRVLVLFRFLSGKDVFEAFYKKDLAKRLLLGRSVSIDAEKSMVAKLKAECGAQFTAKLEGMFKDVELSREAMAAFRSAPAAMRGLGSTEAQVSVLTAGYWPSYPVSELALPEEFGSLQALFSDFYLGKHGGRRLAWQHCLGHCVLKARFAACGVRELSVSLHQAACLLPFNDAARLTLEELKMATRLEDGELRRTLQSLACGKVRVLAKSPKGRDVLDGDAFAVNDALSEPRFRIKVNAIQMKETVEEAAATNEKGAPHLRLTHASDSI